MHKQATRDKQQELELACWFARKFRKRSKWRRCKYKRQPPRMMTSSKLAKLARASDKRRSKQV